eukprot:52778-Amphidinium_carterae.1
MASAADQTAREAQSVLHGADSDSLTYGRTQELTFASRKPSIEGGVWLRPDHRCLPMPTRAPCWQHGAAKECCQKEAALRAESRVLDETRLPSSHERFMTKQVVEHVVGSISDKKTPPTEYMGTTFVIKIKWMSWSAENFVLPPFSTSFPWRTQRSNHFMPLWIRRTTSAAPSSTPKAEPQPLRNSDANSASRCMRGPWLFLAVRFASTVWLQ